MNSGAEVTSFAALEEFYAALANYRVEAQNALSALTMALQRVGNWLDDQQHYWDHQIRVCEEDVSQAAAELRTRKFGNFSGERPDCTLQEENLPENGGTLSVRLPLQWFEAALAQMPVILARKDGRVVLADFKADPGLRSVPVVIFTTSHSRQDIARCYEIGANCYVSKPGNLGEFRTAVQAIEQFWFSVASVPG